uniref:Uncharacterized protein n=1 Tax=Aegilops tauschii TaxID=37682 RepID=R7W3K5_AEGTA
MTTTPRTTTTTMVIITTTTTTTMTAALASSKDGWPLYAAAAVWRSAAAVSGNVRAWKLLVSCMFDIGHAAVSSESSGLLLCVAI